MAALKLTKALARYDLALVLYSEELWTSKVTCGKVKNPICFSPDAGPDNVVTGTPFDASIAPERVCCSSPSRYVKRASPEAGCIVPSKYRPALTVSDTS